MMQWRDLRVQTALSNDNQDTLLESTIRDLILHPRPLEHDLNTVLITSQSLLLLPPQNELPFILRPYFQYSSKLRPLTITQKDEGWHQGSPYNDGSGYTSSKEPETSSNGPSSRLLPVNSPFPGLSCPSDQYLFAGSTRRHDLAPESAFSSTYACDDDSLDYFSALSNSQWDQVLDGIFDRV